MFSFDTLVDLPLIWGLLIATAVFLYVLLDGFDLGLGILFPFAPSDKTRDKMMHSIAPFWDGNETWLVLGGGGLFAAFPLAYAVVMPALYIPVILMLLGLIFRGVAFEFRFKARRAASKKLWDMAFHYGSLLAAFMQGMALGGFVQGIQVNNRAFSGGPFDFISPFSVMTGAAVVAGYALLGATWMVMKMEGTHHHWARKTAAYMLGYVGFFMVLISIVMPFMDSRIATLWFTMPHFLWLLPVPLITALCFVLLWGSLLKGHHYTPFLLSLAVFALGFLGLGVSLWPWVVPFSITVWQGAAAPESLSLLLVGTAIMLPIILGYTAYCYYLFRGKVGDEHHYH